MYKQIAEVLLANNCTGLNCACRAEQTDGIARTTAVYLE